MRWVDRAAIRWDVSSDGVKVLVVVAPTLAGAIATIALCCWLGLGVGGTSIVVGVLVAVLVIIADWLKRLAKSNRW
jgi:hypothetical protein